MQMSYSHLISHVGQVSLHGIGIFPIGIVFRLHFTDPKENTVEQVMTQKC